MKPYDTLVLSGNSTNAIATLGALQKLYDDGILCTEYIKIFVGTSSGSLISALLAIGYEPIEILASISANKSYSKIAGLNLANLDSGLLNFDFIESELANLIVARAGFIPTLEQLATKFGKVVSFVTFNMTDSQREYLSRDSWPDLKVTQACRMSSSFPFIFSPCHFEEKYYIDGGIVDNFAMNYAQTIGTKCFGLFNTNGLKPYSPQMNFFELVFRLFLIFIASASENAFVFPGTESKILKLSYEPNFFNFHRGTMDLVSLFDEGYDKCSESIK